MSDPLNEKLLRLLLAEYARQLDEGIAAAYAAMEDQIKIRAIRVWLPFPRGPIMPTEFPTEADPPEQWEWESTKVLPGLAPLEAAIRRFRDLVTTLEGGQDEQ